MLTIYKLFSHVTVDFAAEELKKYLRMMMPEAGDIAIVYQPDAKDGFRLGLLSHFNLPFEGKDAGLDDVIHVDTTPTGGILAGSNPRSILYSVYCLLRENGCRFIYPGVDGEIIPMKDLEGVRYHKMADHRFRGHCNEGAESQTCMLETIDFYAKQLLNVYSLEFWNPHVYYDRYYSHKHNEKNRPPEPVSRTQTLQWKRVCECEIQKRGMIVLDVGHGWTAEPFGIDSSGGWTLDYKLEAPEEVKPLLALVNGKRDITFNSGLRTNVCLTNPKVQQIFSDAIVTYAKNHQNVDFLGIALADVTNCNCECENCLKEKTVMDPFVKILNMADEKLTKEGISTRLVFPVYHDTNIPPIKERLSNPDRFILEYAPGSRSYTASITEESVIPQANLDYPINGFVNPSTAEGLYAYLKEWQKIWTGTSFTYEYHFWINQNKDLGLMDLSRRIYEDIQSLRLMGLEGIVEDGSQRSYCPHGFHGAIYAQALFDRDVDYDAFKEDYFSHAYGKGWEKVLSLMERATALFDFAYMEGERSSDPERGAFFHPEHAQSFLKVPELCAEERALAKENYPSPNRVETISRKLLALHADLMEGLASILYEKARGNHGKSGEMIPPFLEKMGAYEVEFERYYDHFFVGKNILAMQKDMGKVFF